MWFAVIVQIFVPVFLVGAVAITPQLSRSRWLATAFGAAEQLAGLSTEAMTEVVRYASVESFQAVAVVPLLLLPVFGLIWLVDRKA